MDFRTVCTPKTAGTCRCVFAAVNHPNRELPLRRNRDVDDHDHQPQLRHFYGFLQCCTPVLHHNEQATTMSRNCTLWTFHGFLHCLDHNTCRQNTTGTPQPCPRTAPAETPRFSALSGPKPCRCTTQESITLPKNCTCGNPTKICTVCTVRSPPLRWLLVVGCWLLVVGCWLLVVVDVEWLYYSERIIIVRWADLSDVFFVDFRRKNVCFCLTSNENCQFSSEKQ